jgi:ABC-type amino acid transport substrate-binding protein
LITVSEVKCATAAMSLIAVLVISGCSANLDAGLDPAPIEPQINANTEEVMLDPCAKPNLTTVEPGAITFVTPEVPAPPYFQSEVPADRLGLDADFAYELAEQLGYRPGQVAWEFAPLEQIVQGQFVDFDIALGGFTQAVESAVVAVPVPYPPAALADGTQQPAYSLLMVSENPLVECVGLAMGEMSESGSLADLQRRWIL